MDNYKINVTNTMPKIIYLLLITAVLTYSCSTTKIADKNPPPFIPNVSLTVHSGNANFNFDITAVQQDIQEKFDFINAITYVKLEIINSEDSLFHTLTFNQLDLKGTTEKEKQTSLTLSGSVNWTIPVKLNIKDLKFRYQIFSENKFYDMTKTYSDIFSDNEEDMPALLLEPFIENQTYNSAVFGVIAKRNKTVNNEYIPTSESFRIEIMNLKGHIVWSSTYGKDFLQVINQVHPVNKGDTFKYSLEWDGMTSNRIPLTPGEYSVKMTIPAKPIPYTTTLRLSWNQ